MEEELLAVPSLKVFGRGLRLPWWEGCPFVVWAAVNRHREDFETKGGEWKYVSDACTPADDSPDKESRSASAVFDEPTRYARMWVAKESRRDSQIPVRRAKDGFLLSRFFICTINRIKT